MKIGKIKLFILALFSAISFIVQADVVSDFQSGISLDKAIEKALNQGVPFSKIVTPLILQAGASPISVTKAAIKASKNKVTICHKGKNTLTISSSAVQAHLNHGDAMGACNKNGQQNEKRFNEQIDIMIAAVLSKPEQAPEILKTVLKNVGDISVNNAALLTISATVIVPELEKEIIHAASQVNPKIATQVNFLKTTTFQNGFYEDYTLSRDTGGNFTITTTGGQISVSPNR
ncbi:secreted protein [Beggiatoa sp. PS]|nr:secreted protein [Beggiatoa sp. PS]